MGLVLVMDLYSVLSSDVFKSKEIDQVINEHLINDYAD